jgi:hypothetical protein
MPGFPLADAEPGRITRTVVEISLAELLTGEYIIIVHRPSTQLETLFDPSSTVACGAIAVEKGPTAGSGTGGVVHPPVTGVGPRMADGLPGVLTFGLVALASVLAGMGIVLRRIERRRLSRYAT